MSVNDCQMKGSEAVALVLGFGRRPGIDRDFLLEKIVLVLAFVMVVKCSLSSNRLFQVLRIGQHSKKIYRVNMKGDRF